MNPFRLEGQKTHHVPDPGGAGLGSARLDHRAGGNLGNCSAFGKAFVELKELGLIKQVPRLAIINATGAEHAQ